MSGASSRTLGPGKIILNNIALLGTVNLLIVFVLVIFFDSVLHSSVPGIEAASSR